MSNNTIKGKYLYRNAPCHRNNVSENRGCVCIYKHLCRAYICIHVCMCVCAHFDVLHAPVKRVIDDVEF